MKHSLLGSFPSCLMSPSLMLHFKLGTSHVNHPKISLSLSLNIIIIIYSGILANCLSASCMLWNCFFFYEDACVSLINFLWRCKPHLFLLASSPYKILYYSNFFPASDRNIWLHPIQISMIPEKERSRRLQVLLHEACSINDYRSRDFIYWMQLLAQGSLSVLDQGPILRWTQILVTHI